MKILIISMTAEIGGIEVSLINFLNFISEELHNEVDLMLWKQKGELLDYIPKSVNIIKNPLPGSFQHILKTCSVQTALTWLKLKFFKQIGRPWSAFYRINQKYDIAISYSQDGYSPYYILDNVTAKKKVLWYHHGNYDKSGKEKLNDAHYYMKFDNIVTVSNANKAMLVKYFPFLEEKIIVIQNLINEEEIIRKSKEFKI